MFVRVEWCILLGIVFRAPSIMACGVMPTIHAIALLSVTPMVFRVPTELDVIQYSLRILIFKAPRIDCVRGFTRAIMTTAAGRSVRRFDESGIFKLTLQIVDYCS